MAKDGTIRGGSRTGSGRKPKELNQKIVEGQPASVLTFPEMPVPVDLEGQDMPKVDEWLKEEQQDGQPWMAEELFRRTVRWLRERNCDKLVNDQQIYGFATSAARWIQCQRAISKFGFLARHPTTGAPIESPYVRMADKFYKQESAAWFAIYQIVKDNCTEAYDGLSPQEAVMSGLLSD